MTFAFDPLAPFVLLDDAGQNGAGARLFTGLQAAIIADELAEVAPALSRMQAAHGHYAGYLGFEAGYALEPCLAGIITAKAADDLPLLWFGHFAEMRRIDAGAVAALFETGRSAAIVRSTPCISANDHATMLAHIAALIAAGDIYQANATFQMLVEYSGHPLALYRQLRMAQAAPFGALIHTGAAHGGRWILSFSPEMFFTQSGRQLRVRPMKGTARRGGSQAQDQIAAATLAADPKNRAENLMIVDLLRNDLSRVATDVAVPKLFEIETYPTILSMTSTVTATALPGIGPVEVLRTLFPCGSVTGAPKIRAMEIIAEVEAEPRGLYTGSIGYISGDEAAFNVAIRTLILEGNGQARIGLGSGIVADSEADSEWDECIAKAKFLHARARPTDVIETMRFEPGHGIVRLERHLARAAETLAYLGATGDWPAVRAVLADIDSDHALRIRLLLGKSGAFAVEIGAAPTDTPEPVLVALVPLPVAADDWRLRHKTSDRAFYDAARRASGAFEIVFVRPDGRTTEGSFTNVFVERDGMLLTPRAADGLLPGVLRAELLETGRAVEADLTADDLVDGFLIGNSLRGMCRAKLRRAPA